VLPSSALSTGRQARVASQVGWKRRTGVGSQQS
jgi:hypothetical protein